MLKFIKTSIDDNLLGYRLFLNNLLNTKKKGCVIMSRNGQITKKELSKTLLEQIGLDDSPKIKPCDVQVEGRTLINLLGRRGNAIYKDLSKGFNATVTYDKNNFVIDVMNKELDYGGIYWVYGASSDFFKPNTCYLAICNNENITTSRVSFSVYNANSIRSQNNASKGKGFSYSGFMTPNEITDATYIDIFGYGKGKKCNISDIRLYEISKEELDKINKDPEYTGVRLVEKFPYVEGIQSVVNPYIECNENILANKIINPNMSINDNGQVVYSALSSYVYSEDLKLKNNETYSFYHNFGNEYSDVYIQVIFSDKTWVNYPKGTFSIPANKIIVSSHFIVRHTIPQSQLIKHQELISDILSGKLECSLVKGSIQKTDKECHTSRIVFETKLYEGEKITRDSDGRYVKNSEWDDTSFTSFRGTDVGFHGKSDTNKFKVIRAERLPSLAFGTYLRNNHKNVHLTDHNGTRIPYTGEFVVEGTGTNKVNRISWCVVNNPPGTEYIAIILPNSLTGWGPDYTPTLDEIKAFLLGWRIFAKEGNLTYEDWNNQPTKTKVWCKLWTGVGTKQTINGVDIIAGHSSNICPTQKSYNHLRLYKFIFKKEIPTIEEVKTYGSLVIKDDIDINIGSGLVLDEPYLKHACTVGQSRELINCDHVYLKHRPYKIFNITDDKHNRVAFLESIHNFIHDGTTAYIDHGYSQANIKTDDDVSTYTVDYVMCDTVKSFNCEIYTPQDTQEIIKHITKEVSHMGMMLSSERKELQNRIERSPEVCNDNILINGDFQVWQRGVDFPSATIHGKFTADRWNITKSVENAVSVQKFVGTDDKIYFRFNVESFNTAVPGSFANIQQFLDLDIYKSLIGRKVTVSVKLRDKSLINILGIRAFPDNAVNVRFTKPSDFYQATFTVPRCGTECTKFLFYIQKLEPGILDIEYIKMELGEVSTPMSYKKYSEALAECQRYYITSECPINTSVQRNKDFEGFILPQTMRSIPTVQFTPYGNTGINKLSLWGQHASVVDIEEIRVYNDAVFYMRPKEAQKAALVIGDMYHGYYIADAEIY